jgi:hypothetical protein
MAWYNSTSTTGKIMANAQTVTVANELNKRSQQLTNTRQHLADSREEMSDALNQARLDNLKIMVDHEYDIHTRCDPGYHAEHCAEVIDKLIEQALSVNQEQVTVSTNELKLLSDRLKHTGTVAYKEDRDQWVDARYNVLANNAVFPANEREALLSGGFAIPMADSIPPFSDKYQELIASGEKQRHEDLNVLTVKGERNVRSKLTTGKYIMSR